MTIRLPKYMPESPFFGLKNLRSTRVFQVSQDWQGGGSVKGIVSKLGSGFAQVPISIFRRSDRKFLLEIKSNSNGEYIFKNIAPKLECFIVAFDPNNQYNAVVQDKVVAK